MDEMWRMSCTWVVEKRSAPARARSLSKVLKLAELFPINNAFPLVSRTSASLGFELVVPSVPDCSAYI